MTTITLGSEHFKEENDLFLSDQQDQRFTKVLSTLLVIYLIFAIGLPFLDQVEIPRKLKEQVPAQLAKIMLKEKKLPVPVKPKESVTLEPEEAPKETPKVKPIEQPKMTREAAREKAKISGLAAMKDELFSMREAFDIKPNVQKMLDKNQAQEVKMKRKLLTGAANKQSDGLAIAAISQTIESDALSTKNTQQIRLAEEKMIAKEGGITEQEAIIEAEQRSEITLRRTLEANKARLYALYNRALRKDPFLKGKVMFDIEIQPDGKVSHVKIKSSELNNAKLERQLTVILRSIRFPEQNVSVMTTIWAIDFLPS